MGSLQARRQGRDHYRMFIDGAFVEAASGERTEVENPTTEAIFATIPEG